MNKMMARTSVGQRVMTSVLALLMALAPVSSIGGTMAAEIESQDGNTVVAELRGGVSVQAFTQDFLSNELEGDASMLDAEFTVYDANDKEVCVITTNENGFATTGATALPLGTYSIKQTKASEGYRLNSVWTKTFEIKEDAQIVNLTDDYRWTDAFDFDSNDPSDTRGVANEVIRGGLRVYSSTKDRSETGKTSDDNLGEGDADLAGAEFLIVNASAAPVMVNGQKFQRGKAVLTIWSNEQGIAETAADALPFGRYEVYQIESPDGLYIDSRFVATVAIREDGVVVDGNTYDGKPVQQPIYRGGFEMQKIDALLNEAIAQGDASLEGAVFGVVNNSVFDVYVGGQWYKPGAVCHSFVTDAKGYASVLNLVLPYGSYSIIEMTASAGYQVNKEFKIDFQIREDGKVYDLTGTAFPEYVITGDVQIVKNDIELGKSEAIGGKNHGENEFGTDLNGITYAITNKSAKAVVVDGKIYQPGEVVATISTHWNASANAYTAETENGLLPYGTYSIQEISTNAYYKLTDTTVYTFQIRKQGETVSADVNGNKMVYANQVIRGDIMFEAIEDYSESRMSTVWVLTNLSSGERHVLVTDQNGEYLSHTKFGFAHTENTNANDALLVKIDAGEVIAMTEVVQGSGTWFGLGEAGSMSAANDDLGALSYGKYNLKEVATDSNADYHRELKSFDFYIYRDGKVVDLGTVENDHAAPTASLSGEAIDDTTGSQIGIAIENTTIVDTVSYDNLVSGYTYKLIGTLYSKNSGGPLAVPDGKGGYTNVVVEHQFTAAQSSGEIDMIYNFNGSELDGDSVVIYLTLIDVYKNSKGELVENKILDSNDINNAKQTVVYPAISTELIVDMTDGHDAPSVEKLTVTDTVYYTNLVPGRNYTVKGVLMDVATGNDAVDANGNDIRATATFTADAASGSVELSFTFDASNMGGKTLVAFEEVLYRNVTVARHVDMNDKAQTISFPVIDTDASCEATGNNEGVVGTTVIEDVVSFKGLVVGETYKLTGKLLDKATGKVIMTVEKEFTASTSEGFVSVMFNVDSTELAGKTVVVFEALARGEHVLTAHADVDDVDQTISFPVIETSIVYGDSGIREGAVSSKTVLVDTVKYRNLIVGEEYKVVGSLMDKFSGAPVVDAEGNAITAEVVFKTKAADGSVEVRFEFDSRHLAGDTVVAFETLYRNDIALVSHADIEDEEQTIRFAAIETILSDKASNDNEIAVDAVILTDVISYKNLIVGAEYEIKTVLMDKDTGKALEGFEAIVTKFKPESADGDIAIEIKLDASKLAGKTLVAFETISRDGKVIVEHVDIEDVAQTVTVPVIDSSAILNDTGAIDTIQYNNLHVGRNYTMISEVLDVNGKVLDKVVATFVPKTEKGMIKARIEFIFDVEKYAGQNVTVRETLYGQMGQFLCMDETVLAVPVIEQDATESTPTEPDATEPDSTEPTTPPSTEQPEHKHAHVVTKTVKPTCTEAGYSVYTCECGDAYTVMDASATGHTWGDWTVVDAATVEVEGKEARICDACGKIETRTIAKLPGSDTTEPTPTEPKPTEPETDPKPTDPKPTEPQPTTPNTPAPDDKLSVNAISIKTNTAMLEIGEKVKIKAIVEYKDLVVGETYVVTSVLSDKNGEAVRSVRGDEMAVGATFVAAATSGKVELTFEEMNTESLQGNKYTVHTTILLNGKTIVSESDDYVHVADLDTKATSDKKTKYLVLDKDVALIDTVKYFNLVPGQRYYIEGKVLNASTGALVTGAQNKSPVVKLEFTPKETNGTLEMKFYLDTTKDDGETYVVVQTLYDANGNKLAEHYDLKDKDQSVIIKTVADVQTGVYENVGLITTLAVVTMLIGVAFVIVGRKRNLFAR